MYWPKRILLVSLLLALCCSGAYAAGAYGHFLIAQRVIDRINSGEHSVPEDLKIALKDDDCRRAFRGGAVAPDICENDSHYGNTGDMARAMIAKATKSLAEAKKSGDRKAIKEARVGVAFCYGWLTHCAADVNIHPLVNGIAGDSYRYCTDGQKAIHAGQEVQLDKFLHANYKETGEKYEVRIPENFLSQFVKLKPNELRHNLRSLNLRVMGELEGKEFVYLDNAKQLKPKWDRCIANCISDSVKLIEDPDRMGNWDLDSGPISTDDFRDLRMLVMKANGGKLPKNWGSSYLDYYHKALDKIAEEKKTKPGGGGKAAIGAPKFDIPAMPKVHKPINDVDKIQLRAWRDKCIPLLNKQMEDDPLRAANREECNKLSRQNREMTCGKCGFAGVHWWIEPSWSCPSCEFCTMPQDVRRADGKTYRQFAEERMKIYKDKIAEIEATVARMTK